MASKKQSVEDQSDGDSTDKTTSSSTPKIKIMYRWQPGMGPAHRKLAADLASTETRSAYQLYVHRSELDREHSEERGGNDGVYDLYSSSESDEDEHGAGERDVDAKYSKRVDRVKERMKGVGSGSGAGQGGTLKWLGNGLRKAKVKVKKQASHHTQGGAQPETEKQAAI